MNGIVKVALRIPKITRAICPLVNRAQVPVKRDFTRSIWHMCASRQGAAFTPGALLQNHSDMCSCGCGIKGVHTKGERELVEFLTEEIVAERKSQKLKAIPNEFEGFLVKLTGAEVELSKKNADEAINITFNVNHTVDADETADADPRAEKQDFAEMRSRPQFEVDIVRGDTTLGFTCSFIQDTPQAQEGENYNDIFGIDEVTIYKGEWNDKVYAVAGDVLDGYLYDLLMNLLEEKGVSNEFVGRLSDFSTAYEHKAYIGLLEDMSKFATNK